MTAIQENLIDQSDTSRLSGQQEKLNPCPSSNAAFSYSQSLSCTAQGHHVHSTRDDYAPQGSMKFLTLSITKCKVKPESITSQHLSPTSETSMASSSTGAKNGCNKFLDPGHRSGYCHQCDKDVYNLSHHMNVHKEKKPFECSECGKSYCYKSSLEHHMRMHEGVGVSQCEECGIDFTFQDNRDLASHITSRRREDTFTCAVCNREFSSRSYLIAHMDSHLGVRNFECRECGKTFFRHSELQYHLMAHKGGKPFQCGLCYFAVQKLSELQQHLLIHTETGGFLCTECGRRFSCSGNVKRHWKLYHSSQRKCFSCMGKIWTTSPEHKFAKSTSSQEICSGKLDDFGSSVSLQPVSARLPDDFVLHQTACLHPNIAVTYGVTTTDLGRMLVMERLETSLSNLLSEAGDKVTVRERVDLAIGIVSAIDYLHNQLAVPHGYLDTRHVFFTSSLTAKVLDPIAAFLLSDERTRLTSRLTVIDDMKQLGRILLAMFDGYRFSFWDPARGTHTVVNMAVLLDSSGRVFLSDVRSLLYGLKESFEYMTCNPKRYVVCDTA